MSATPERQAVVSPTVTAAEKAVICALFSDPLAYPRVAPILEVEDFTQLTCAACYAAAGRLAHAGKSPNLVTICGDLEEHRELAGIGGMAAVAHLTDGLADAGHVEDFAEIVRDAALKRQLADFGRQLVQDASDPQGGGEDLASGTAARLAAISSRRGSPDAESVGSIARRELKRIENVANVGPCGVRLGFVDLDRILVSVEPGALCIVAGRPGDGKTALLSAVTLNACERGQRVMLFSLEMPREQITARLLSTLSRVPLLPLRSGCLQPDDWQKLTWAQDKLDGWKLVIDDKTAISAEQVLARARRQALSSPLDLVLVDYLQKCSARGENRTQVVGAIARGLKDTARSLGVPVIVAAQLSRLNVREDRAPALSDLRDSGEIEQEADVVLLMHPLTGADGTRVVQVEVAKHRNGPTGTTRLAFTEGIVEFRNYRGAA